MGHTESAVQSLARNLADDVIVIIKIATIQNFLASVARGGCSFEASLNFDMEFRQPYAEAAACC